MRRALSTRIFSALIAGWLAFVLAEPAALHICPAHDGIPATSADVAEHGAPAPAGGSHEAAHHATSSDHADLPGTPHQCTCVGHCAGSSAARVPGMVSAMAAAIVPVRDAVPSADFRFAPPPAEYLLPFANGPPALPV